MKDALTNWKESDLITGSLWNLGARDKSGAHADTGGFHGLCVPQVFYQLIRRFTEPEDLVLDLFTGSGTSGVEAKRLGRHWVGVELNKETADAARALIGSQPNPFHVLSHVIEGNSQELLSTAAAFRVGALGSGKVEADLTILHPPYHDIIKFSDDPKDLSNCTDVTAFRAALKQVLVNARDLTRSKGCITLVIGDAYEAGRYLPLSAWAITDAEDTGLTLKAVCVKDIQGNEKGKGKNGPLWRYRALKNGLYVFQHEYIVVFRKE